MSCSEISKRLKTNRITLSKYLSVLESEGIIYFKDFGMAKAWYVQKSPILECFKGSNGHTIKSLLDCINDGILVVDNNLNVVWANKTIKNMINYKKNMNGAHFFDIFKEAEILREQVKCREAKKLIFDDNINKQKIKTSISPILNINNDSVGFIHVLNVEKINE